MLTYPKIQTLFERDENFRVNLLKFKNPVMGTINTWLATEKIDGTNIRINYDPDAFNIDSDAGVVTFGGRTDNAQLPGNLVKHLMKTFTPERLSTIRKGADTVWFTLYGEGYGAGIQKVGRLYREDQGFILFDVLVNDTWWLSDDAVTEIAKKLEIPRVPVLGVWSMVEIIHRVKRGFCTYTLEPGSPCESEGIVARPLMPLYDHRHRRVIIKLKTHDFEMGKR